MHAYSKVEIDAAFKPKGLKTPRNEAMDQEYSDHPILQKLDMINNERRDQMLFNASISKRKTFSRWYSDGNFRAVLMNSMSEFRGNNLQHRAHELAKRNNHFQ